MCILIYGAGSLQPTVDRSASALLSMITIVAVNRNEQPMGGHKISLASWVSFSGSDEHRRIQAGNPSRLRRFKNASLCIAGTGVLPSLSVDATYTQDRVRQKQIIITSCAIGIDIPLGAGERGGIVPSGLEGKALAT